MFFVSILLVWIVKFLTTQALLILTLSGWEFDETKTINKVSDLIDREKSFEEVVKCNDLLEISI